MTTKSHFLIETDIDLILSYIRTNIPAVLTQAISDKGTLVNLEIPRSYFISEQDKGYLAPAIFVVGDNIDFRISNNANFIDALSRVNVTAVVEERNADRLTRIAYRYQAALHTVLAQQPIVSADNKVKIVVKVERAEFSPIYHKDNTSNDATGVFRKEVWLSCAVEHYEKLS